MQYQTPDGQTAHFELVNCKCVDTYVRIKRNQNQICWKWRKVVVDTPRRQHIRHFLDGQQYSMHSVLRYEKIFGRGFCSTGELALAHGSLWYTGSRWQEWSDIEYDMPDRCALKNSWTAD